jgi:C1A family cysteine protease
MPYWIVRNTYGKSWGMDGYIHIAFGKLIWFENQKRLTWIVSNRKWRLRYFTRSHFSSFVI